jgi:ankyrin repeat protein
MSERTHGAALPVVVTEAEEQRYAELQLLALDYARQGETQALSSMLAFGLPVNLEDPKGNTLLMLAAYHGQVETLALLLETGAEVDRRNHRGQTPLGGAAFKGDLPIIEKLLAAGADIEADNGNGMTPLMFATLFGRTEAARVLKKHGASSRARSRFGLRAGGLGWLAPIFRRLLPRPGRRTAA